MALQHITYPTKLKKGSHIRVIAPSSSASVISNVNMSRAKANLEDLGYKISYGKNIFAVEKDLLHASIGERISDLHQAYLDSSVDCILTVLGGYNSNQLLDYIDFDLIKANPKIFCGYSDITVLANAITEKTNIATYYGPHFSSWAMEIGFVYSKEYFKKCLANTPPYEVTPSKNWSEDQWYNDQINRTINDSDGYIALKEGRARGRIIGGHISSFVLLHGTNYLPKIDGDLVLVIEAFEDINARFFDSLLQSMIQQPYFKQVKGILLGRFRKESGINIEIFKKILASKVELVDIPIIANVNVGHTNPIAIFPVGGICSIVSEGSKVTITIEEH